MEIGKNKNNNILRIYKLERKIEFRNSTQSLYDFTMPQSSGHF